MLKSIWNDVRRELNSGTMVSRLIVINIAIFIGVNLLRLTLYLSSGGSLPPIYHDIVHFFAVSTDWMHNLTHPWVFITSQFVHEGFWHLLWNMLFLYWFGKIVGDLIGDRKILPIYLLGGIAGCVVFWLSAQFFPGIYGGTHYAIGASAGVMAIVVASGVLAPEYLIHLIIIGAVRLKYVVLVLVLLDVFAIGNDFNTGGHFAHLGGAFLGMLFVQQLRSGNDWAVGVNKVLDGISNLFNPHEGKQDHEKRHQLVVKKTYRKEDKKLTYDTDIAERVDEILDKINEKGIRSLTEEERNYLKDYGGGKY